MSVPANGRASANLATPSRSTPPKSVGVGARARPSTARRPAGRGCAKGPVARHACKIANAQADRACLTSAPVHKYHQRRRARRGRAAPLSWAARSGPPPCRGGPPGRPSAGASSAGRAAPGRPPRPAGQPPGGPPGAARGLFVFRNRSPLVEGRLRCTGPAGGCVDRWTSALIRARSDTSAAPSARGSSRARLSMTQAEAAERGRVALQGAGRSAEVTGRGDASGRRGAGPDGRWGLRAGP